MNADFDLCGLLSSGLESVLNTIEDAVLVLDRDRTLRFVNLRARQILGYSDGEAIGGRCKLTTRGVDCQNACPLTFALEGDLADVQEFQAVYRSREGDSVPLRVTVIPLRKDDGSFAGAVEILRPTRPDPGFFAAGRSPRSERLRKDIARLAALNEPVVLVGEAPACADVAAAIHRHSGLPEELFLTWKGSWDGIPQWPPGTVFSAGDGCLLQEDAPAGWRVVVGVGTSAEIDAEAASRAEILRLPKIGDLEINLPIMIKAWLEQIRPGIKVAPEAMVRLTQIALERGLSELQEMLFAAVETADGRIEVDDLEIDGFRSVCVDELLEAEDPLAAMEKKLLREVLDRHDWRMQDAADRLGISRVTLWRKLKECNIERP